MIVVFWLETLGDGWFPDSKKFESEHLTQALEFAEDLRAQRRRGRILSHICISSELSSSVGEAGVSDPNADYNWYKRREDPLNPIGRSLGEKE